ncbi:dihydrodipicolinate synthase family protein [Alteromonas oceanisediminis]|uniref:dihydrodipicolinate synthase family protein n=1 Tax=Alteromonas oceanisediminis TaxID=2836180 RepID=UPI001BD9CDBD|nr:dihydrodipicolinate synthase family protein [Alteromonas oceanisediminis]MBT0587069.1 dihydrodipicolinate synthase family protein [Alteromonas oceanisediminis]
MKKVSLNAHALTPVRSGRFDPASFARIVENLRDAQVGSISLLGAAGCGLYFSIEQRKTILEQGLVYAEDVEVMVGVSALNSYDVLTLAEHAQLHGAAYLLIAPCSYQTLSEDEVLRFYKEMTQNVSIPICINENTITTQFSFSLQLLSELTKLPHIEAVKISSFRHGNVTRTDWIKALKSTIDPKVKIGLSGDPHFASALTSEINVWHSVVAGIFPDICVSIVNALDNGHLDQVDNYQNLLGPLMELYKTKVGTVRVTATAAEILSLCNKDSLPPPLISLTGTNRTAVESAIRYINEDQIDTLQSID